MIANLRTNSKAAHNSNYKFEKLLKGLIYFSLISIVFILLYTFVFNKDNSKKFSSKNGNGQPDENINKIKSINTDTIEKLVDNKNIQNSIPQDTIKKISLKEFANEYITNVKSSKKYFLENSEGDILETGYDFVKGYLDDSKVKSFSSSSVRLRTNDDDYEADLKFKKTKKGIWKAYMLDTFGE